MHVVEFTYNYDLYTSGGAKPILKFNVQMCDMKHKYTIKMLNLNSEMHARIYARTHARTQVMNIPIIMGLIALVGQCIM